MQKNLILRHKVTKLIVIIWIKTVSVKSKRRC
ncbi:MAG: hypothetical protein ACLR2G_11345 [Phascolarctobacterium faecium]